MGGAPRWARLVVALVLLVLSAQPAAASTSTTVNAALSTLSSLGFSSRYNCDQGALLEGAVIDDVALRQAWRWGAGQRWTLRSATYALGPPFSS